MHSPEFGPNVDFNSVDTEQYAARLERGAVSSGAAIAAACAVTLCVGLPVATGSKLAEINRDRTGFWEANKPQVVLDTEEAQVSSKEVLFTKLDVEFANFLFTETDAVIPYDSQIFQKKIPSMGSTVTFNNYYHKLGFYLDGTSLDKPVTPQQLQDFKEKHMRTTSNMVSADAPYEKLTIFIDTKGLKASINPQLFVPNTKDAEQQAPLVVRHDNTKEVIISIVDGAKAGTALVWCNTVGRGIDNCSEKLQKSKFDSHEYEGDLTHDASLIVESAVYEQCSKEIWPKLKEAFTQQLIESIVEENGGDETAREFLEVVWTKDGVPSDEAPVIKRAFEEELAAQGKKLSTNDTVQTDRQTADFKHLACDVTPPSNETGENDE